MASINTLITNISNQNISLFFENKITSFKPERDVFINTVNDEAPFSDPVKIGHSELFNHEELLVFSCEYDGELTERSAKKQQFEIAKKVLKEDFKDGAIFIFYDKQGNFRFSFIRRNYGETGDKKYSAWKRYTYYVTRSETNRTFKERIDNCVFDSLDNIQEAFSVEKLTKQFYNELFAWYQWALSDEIGITYPNNTNTSDDDRVKLEEQVIRLITRLLFVWFIKQKKLVPEYLFKIDELSKTLKDFDSNSSEQGNYYNAILQNLFFATLNKEISEREFAKTKNRDIKTRYRYEEMFNLSESEILELFKPIPFLNGGLFECLDKQDADGNQYFLDGFSRNPTKSANGNFRHRAFLPNCLFFDEEKGIIPLLRRYNFTVEENAPNEVQVALDPELLGKVFENLLGAFNPETKETARKQSGSFYTPREIVDYMVDESLINYLTNKLPNAGEDTLRELFEKEHLPETLVNNINLRNDIAQHLKAIKILDPACGSGAFPMGILNKMIEVLEKLDAKSEYIHDLKLHLIEECIYGIDIQPIAIQISKLRFFISLVVEQGDIDINKPGDNYGVLTLPNLETKFVAANTLIGIKAKPKQHNLFEDPLIEETKEELLTTRHEHFYAKTAGAKKRLREEDAILRNKLEELLKESEHYAPEDALQFSKWNPYDQNTSSPFFDIEWMYGLQEGFDVVIGNPPYGAKLSKEEKAIYKKMYPESQFKIDTYSLFLLKSVDLLKTNAICTYIIPNTLLDNYFEEEVRKKLLINNSIVEINDLNDKVFNDAVVHSMIFAFQKSRIDNYQIKVNTSEALRGENQFIPNSYFENQNYYSFAIRSHKNKGLIDKLEANSKHLEEVLDIRQAIKSGNDNIYIVNERIDNNHKPIFRGKDIKKFKLNNSGLFINYGKHLACRRDYKIFEQPKILIREAGSKITAAYDNTNSYVMSSLYNAILKDKHISLKYILGLLNSQLFQFLMNIKTFEKTKGAFTKAKIYHYYDLPVNISDDHKPIIKLVDEIIRNKQDNLNTDSLEAQLNIQVYKLYNLNYKEVLIIEPEFSLTQEEYDNYKIES